jgi:hypothetical protein
MTACNAEQKVSVNPRLQRALAANFTTKGAARRVTAVALIRPAGMVRKHARDSISRFDVPREKSMPFAKQLSKELSCHQSHSQFRLQRQFDRSTVSGRPSNCDRPLLTSSQEDTSQPAILEVLLRLMLKAVARFAEHAGTAFPNLLLAIISWTVAEFLAGCAAYAKAMYPPPPMADERVVPASRCRLRARLSTFCPEKENPASSRLRETETVASEAKSFASSWSKPG